MREVWPRLSSDEKKLFDVIARAYLAALMPDFRYRQTTATLDVRGFEFRAAGRQPIDLGWRAAFPEWQPADEKGAEAQLLPPLRNGETAQLQDAKIEDKETRPPPRYNEGTLIEAMQNAFIVARNLPVLVTQILGSCSCAVSPLRSGGRDCASCAFFIGRLPLRECCAPAEIDRAGVRRRGIRSHSTSSVAVVSQ